MMGVQRSLIWRAFGTTFRALATGKAVSYGGCSAIRQKNLHFGSGE